MVETIFIGSLSQSSNFSIVWLSWNMKVHIRQEIIIFGEVGKVAINLDKIK